MGLNCQIIRKGDVIERVEAPNGEPSSLYENAKRLLGDAQKALMVWAKAYTPGFLSHYGYWRNPKPGEFYNTDQNGEPMVDDVIAYMKANTYISEPFANTDVMDLQNTFLSSGISDIRSFGNTIYGNFYINGNIVINETNLRRSGIYSEEEINRILSDQSIANNLAISMRKVVDYMNNENNSQKEEYYFSNDNVYGPVIGISGKFNQFGKQEVYNPAELYEAMRYAVGGIQDRSSFDNAFESLSESYPELVDRYRNDAEFASQIFDEFSTMTSVPVVTIENGNVVYRRSKTLSKIENFYHPNPAKIEKAREVIGGLIMNLNNGDTKSIMKGIRDMEEAATWFGIDMIGISKAYENRGDSVLPLIEDVALDLDILLSRRGDVEYAQGLASSIDAVMGDSTARRVMKLPANMAGGNIVYMESPLSDSEMFESYYLLRVGENLYHKLYKDGNVDKIYESVSELATIKPSSLPAAAYPKSYFKNGILDVNKVKNGNPVEIVESMRRYVLSNTDSDNNEEMVAIRIALGYGVRPASRRIDEQREFNRYMNRRGDHQSESAPMDLYNGYLANKLRNTDLYNNVYKYLDFDNGTSVKLRLTDPYSMKSVDLFSRGKLRDTLFDYSMISNDPSLSDLFYLENQDLMYAGEDFKHYLYTAHPELLPEFKSRESISEIGEALSIEGTYEGFVKIDGNIYMKIGEWSNGSIYQSFSGTEAEVKYDSTQKSKKIDIDKNQEVQSNLIKQNFSISKEESAKLGRLEC